MKVKNIISKINNQNFYSLNLAVKEVNLGKADCIAKNYNFSHHCNFDIATNIYKCEDGYVAITGLINDRNKIGYHTYNIPSFAEEYITVPKIVYIPKVK